MDSRITNLRTPIAHHAVIAAATLMLFTGCRNIVPPLYGIDPGRAASAIFTYSGYADDSTTDFMVVLTSVESACTYMTSDTQPMEAGDWVLSAWQTSGSSGGYFSTVQNGQVAEHEALTASITIDHLPSATEASEGEPSKGRFVLTFENGDQVDVRFKAYYCSNPLLNGLK